MIKKNVSPIFEAMIAAAGMFFFGLFAHTGMPLRALSFGGLFLTFLTLLYALRSTPSPAEVLGFAKFSNKAAVYTVFCFFFGVVLAIFHRWGYGVEILPTTFRRFVGVAALIGATEEILYRGYIQGCVRKLGPFKAAIFASLGHTLYKCSLFVFPNRSVDIDIGFLAVCTFGIGLMLGTFRERAGSVWPPLIAHAVFDMIVYGEYGPAPWWVWL